MLSAAFSFCYAERRYAECCFAECRGAKKLSQKSVKYFFEYLPSGPVLQNNL
jgi:hypothetical protein